MNRYVETVFQNSVVAASTPANGLLHVNVIETPLDLGDYRAGDPPLPIPNREVKPRSADGTAQKVEE